MTIALAKPTASASGNCGKGWVYFDLGDTLIDTHDWDHLKYLQGAHDYLNSLKSAGFHLGLIVNIPEKWGDTESKKIAKLKDEVAKTWSEGKGFHWDYFERLLVPPTDRDRKPSSFLFEQARRLGGSCKIAYQGEDVREVRVAEDAGFHQVYVVGRQNSPFFLPINSIFRNP
ncbi:hypothetical protein WDW37_19310 [Bdellovibrionota bacterium FG-1]